jgi:carbonic anhydrase
LLPITQIEQSRLTPDEVLEDLLKGNQQYMSGTLEDGNLMARMSAAVKGQYPQAYVLSCVDSRVPVESIFNQGLGDIFVGRVAGNIENETSWASWNLLPNTPE